MNKKTLASLDIFEIRNKITEAKRYKVQARCLMMDEDNDVQREKYKENYYYWLEQFHLYSSLFNELIKLYGVEDEH